MNNLYQKHRPQKFNEIMGQDVIVRILSNSIKNNSISNAYLLYGIRGTGKTTIARIFAKALNCENKIGIEPCDNCDSCKSIKKSNSFDVIEIDAASNNGVDEMRQLKEKANYLSTHSKYKVYIIDEFHMLSKSAFNALLKILEEPPKNVIFILLTTEINKIPETILSRSIILNLNLIPEQKIIDEMKIVLDKEKISYDIESLKIISENSGGSLRDALTLLESIVLYSDNINKKSVIEVLGIENEISSMDLLKHDFSNFIKDIAEESINIKNYIKEFIRVATITYIKENDKKGLELIDEIIEFFIRVRDPILLKTLFVISLNKRMIVNLNTNENTIKQSENISFSQKTNTNIKTISTNNSNNLIKDKEKTSVDTTKNLNETKKDTNNKGVGLANYLDCLNHSDESNMNKIRIRYEILCNTKINKENQQYFDFISKGMLVSASENAFILKYESDNEMDSYKQLVTDSKFYSFVKEMFGEYYLILALTNEKWNVLKKIYSKKKNEGIEIERVNMDPLAIFGIEINDEEDNEYSKMKSIFGEKLEE